VDGRHHLGRPQPVDERSPVTCLSFSGVVSEWNAPRTLLCQVEQSLDSHPGDRLDRAGGRALGGKGQCVRACNKLDADGKSLIVSEGSGSTGRARVALLPVEGKEGAAALVEVQSGNVDSGQVSPDSRWIAYRSDESGKNEIYISSFPKPGGKLQVSNAGGMAPRWRGDAKELYYRQPVRGGLPGREPDVRSA